MHLLIADSVQRAAASLRLPVARFLLPPPCSASRQLLATAVAAISLAGLPPHASAATLVATTPSPATFPVGQPIPTVGFSVTETNSVASWRLGGNLPSGLKLVAQDGSELTAPGVLDATRPGEDDGYGYVIGAVTETVPRLTGTPITPGSYTITLQPQPPGQTFEYTIIIASSVPPATNPPAGTREPAFARQPVTQTVATGSTVVFAVEVSASPAPTYQWRKDGAAITGATGASLVIARARATDAGSYSVVATNAAGAVSSTSATLVLSSDPNFGRLINLSIRTSLTASDPSFIVGTVVGGAGTSGLKPLLVRAVGPSLAAFGLTTALSDAKLEVFAGASVVAANDNWAGDPALSSAFGRVGAFPLASATSMDAAVFSPAFPARDYTVAIGAAGGATGDVIAELYDATPASAFSATTPRLINVSVRKQIEATDSLTAGFVVGGNTARTVLVRAIGPGLAAFGVPGTMPDPQLALYRGGQQIAANDNWGGDAQLTAAGSAVGAFAIADTAGKDAILLITLAPGNYTAEVKAVSSGGSALVELYEVP